MAIVDSDAHVIESERTWEFMRDYEQDFRPFVVVPKTGEANLSGGFAGRRSIVSEYWVIEGRAVQKRSNFRSVEVAEEAAELADIEQRLAHMDELGVDVHVLYPTVFLRPLTRRPEVEVALYRSYNRWMDDIYTKGDGRLRYVAMLPYMSRDVAIEEMHWAKDHGACGFFMHSVEGDRRLSDTYFDPIYNEASEIGLPMCVHATSGNFSQFDLFQTDAGFSTFKLPVVGAFHDLLMKGTPSRFPDLRWAFVEVIRRVGALRAQRHDAALQEGRQALARAGHPPREQHVRRMPDGRRPGLGTGHGRRRQYRHRFGLRPQRHVVRVGSLESTEAERQGPGCLGRQDTGHQRPHSVRPLIHISVLGGDPCRSQTDR